MKKIFITVLSLLAIGAFVDAGTIKIAEINTADEILGRGELVCTVDFATGSSALSEEARDIINKNIDRIKSLDLEKKMLRIEGFASPDGDKAKNYRLSIDRARAVESFLRLDHGVSLDNYISGFGPTTPVGVAAAGKKSVQIVIYDNPWSQGDIPAKTASGQ